MKRLKIIILVVISFIIGFNFKTIIKGVKTELKRIDKIDYCSEVYKGNSYKIQACLNK